MKTSVLFWGRGTCWLPLSRSLNPDAGTAKYKIRIYTHNSAIWLRASERAAEYYATSKHFSLLSLCLLDWFAPICRADKHFSSFFLLGRLTISMLPLGLLHAQLVVRHGLNAQSYKKS
jgi:hypothetical protein